MATHLNAREMERLAAAARPPRDKMLSVPVNGALAMLVRRGLRPIPTRLDLPFPSNLPVEAADCLAHQMNHYAFRLFLRGVIQKPEGFTPGEATSYVTAERARMMAESLVDLGIAEKLARGRYRLVRAASSFGGALEWYVARELDRQLGLEVAVGIKFRARGVGGDLDIVATAEGKLVYLELKSSPPKHLSDSEVAAFFDRLHVLRPDVTLFVMDTALRLTDKVVPMLLAELRRRSGSDSLEALRIERELWALTPHLYAVNARPNLITNIAHAIAEGLLALSPKISRARR